MGGRELIPPLPRPFNTKKRGEKMRIHPEIVSEKAREARPILDAVLDGVPHQRLLSIEWDNSDRNYYAVMNLCINDTTLIFREPAAEFPSETLINKLRLLSL